jgi:hypothetical protein
VHRPEAAFPKCAGGGVCPPGPPEDRPPVFRNLLPKLYLACDLLAGLIRDDLAGELIAPVSRIDEISPDGVHGRLVPGLAHGDEDLVSRVHYLSPLIEGDASE